MKRYAENNRVGVCHPLRREGLYVDKYTNGYIYLDNGVRTRASTDVPLYSYGKTFTKWKQDFGLFVWSTNSDRNEIEDLFEKSLKKVTKKMINSVDRGTFLYID